jgi:CheY-like chemotaxis protein
MQPVQEGPSSPPGILVVEDEPAVLKMLEFALRQDGFAVWLSKSGTEALDLYRQHRDQIDLVLLAVEMPGFDGPATFAELQKLNPAVRCCFMTAGTEGYRVDDLLARGAILVIPKPFPDLTELAETLRKLARPS